MPKICRKRNFDWGPWFGPRAPKKVKIGRNTGLSLSPPTVFELNRSNFRDVLSLPRPKICRKRNFDWAPRFLGAGSRKFQKFEKKFVFQRRGLKSVLRVPFRASVSYLVENFDSGPRFGPRAPKSVKILKFLICNVEPSNFVSV